MFCQPVAADSKPGLVSRFAAAGLTVTVTSSVGLNWPSLAVSRST